MYRWTMIFQMYLFLNLIYFKRKFMAVVNIIIFVITSMQDIYNFIPDILLVSYWLMMALLQVSRNMQLNTFQVIIRILCFVDCASLYDLVNRTNLVHNLRNMFYCFSLHVLGKFVPIIRRKYLTYATPGICHCPVCRVE